MRNRQCLLAIFAHPDDESFTAAGTLARYTSQGIEVSLICATRGEAGEIADSALAQPENLGQVREQELRCAGDILGLKEVIFLDYRDSGMAGSEANGHPEAFVNAPAYQVVPKLVWEMRRLRPQVVITFEPGGGYGHPDHLAIHHAVAAAVQAAAAAAYRPDLGPAWPVRRLFYTSLPHAFFAGLNQRLVRNELDNSELEEMLNRPDRSFWPDDEVDVIIDVSGFMDRKLAAILCHQTQLNEHSFFMRLPEPELREQWSKEYFGLAWPKTGQKLADDLFTGL
jgi:LmbE family N-acetylglucosaminyl deacetylase